MQKVDFSFEVIIADDYSTDGTREIVLEYKQQFPELIKLILQKKNVGATQNWLELITSPNSKYIAYFEGDDYWNDPNKLQKQVNFLENNPAFVLCHHAFLTLQEGGLINPNNRNKINSEKPVISFEDILNFPYPKTLTVVFRSDALRQYDLWHYMSGSKVGDIPLWHLLLLNGKGFFLNEIMGCYRSNPTSITNNLVPIISITISKIVILEKILDAKLYKNRSLLREYLAKHYYTLFYNMGSLIYFSKAFINKIQSRYLFSKIEIKNRVNLSGLIASLIYKLIK